MKLKNILSGIVAAILALSLAIASPSFALANDNAGNTPLKTHTVQEMNVENLSDDDLIEANSSITPQLLEQARIELENSSISRSYNPDGTVTYELKEGFFLTLNSSDQNMMTPVPFLHGGFSNNGFWIQYNQFDQDMLISGSGFALGAIICAIPGVGTAACVVVGAVITAATVALSHNKKCKRDFRVHYNYLGQVVRSRCV